jgi:hypothetical protein
MSAPILLRLSIDHPIAHITQTMHRSCHHPYGLGHPSVVSSAVGHSYTKENSHLDKSNFHPTHNYLSPAKRTHIEAFVENIDPRDSFAVETPPLHFNLDDQSGHPLHAPCSFSSESRSLSIPLTAGALRNYSVAYAMSPSRAYSETTYPSSHAFDGSPSKNLRTGTNTVHSDNPRFVRELENGYIATEDYTDPPINLDELIK